MGETAVIQEENRVGGIVIERDCEGEVLGGKCGSYLWDCYGGF